MIVKPKIRGFICTTAHPIGCAQHVQEQIEYARENCKMDRGPKKVLIIGASTGYGLASRITAAFGFGAATVGVIFEREAEGKRTATAGWYNTVGFEQKAIAAGLYTKTVNGDAFSNEVKKQVVDVIKKDLGQVDLVIYSVASPRRQHPDTGVVSKSVLKPLGKSYTNMSIDMSTRKLEEVTLLEATQEEVDQTVAVMGGEDWAMWMDLLNKEGLLADGIMTVAYSYMGPEVTRAIYRNGTIGKAKEHLEKTAKDLEIRLRSKNGQAYVSVNKALVTQSSSAIPFIPLYFVILKKTMKEKNIEEDCIQQICRLFTQKLYSGNSVPVDENGLIRIDDLELRNDVQAIVNESWNKLTAENIGRLSDLEGYEQDFLKLFGFGLNGVDYEADVDVDLRIPTI